MTSHCRDCGSRLCNHGNCPECAPCKHCDGGDRSDKFFGYEDNTDPQETPAERYPAREIPWSADDDLDLFE